MPNCAKKQIIVSSNIIATKNPLQGLAKNHVDAYYWLLNNKLVPMGTDLVDDIIKNSRGFIFPVDTTYLENYLDGYKLVYVPFNPASSGIPDYIDGFWDFGEDRTTVRIFYNNNRPPKRQLFTKIHETMHFCQSLDQYFIDLVDYLKTKTSVPQKFIEKLIDKSADKAAAMYLMPTKYLLAKCKETTDVQTLSDFFQASPSTVQYRLKECGIIQQY